MVTTCGETGSMPAAAMSPEKQPGLAMASGGTPCFSMPFMLFTSVAPAAAGNTEGAASD